MPYVMTQSHKDKIGESVSRVRSGKPLTDKHRGALIGSHINRKKVKCIHCDCKYAVNVIKRHEKSCIRNVRVLDGVDKQGGHTRPQGSS